MTRCDDGNTFYIDTEACGCRACSTQVQPGHFACEPSSDYILRREANGTAERVYEDGVWRWILTIGGFGHPKRGA